MAFPECLAAAYVGWSTQAWVVAIVASALPSALVSLPFWINRDRFWGIAAISFFVALFLIHGIAECPPQLPDWAGWFMALPCLVLVGVLYLLVLRPRVARPPEGGA